VLDPEVELVPLISLELPVPLDVPAVELLPCAEEPAPGDEVPDCCAAAMPIENRAAVAIVRSFLDIYILLRKWRVIKMKPSWCAMACCRSQREGNLALGFLGGY
jgi:hypothetical protein